MIDHALAECKNVLVRMPELAGELEALMRTADECDKMQTAMQIRRRRLSVRNGG